MSNQQYNDSVEKADKAFTHWCEGNDIPLHGIHHVITWEDWDDGIGVYAFLHDIADVEELQTAQVEEMKNTYLEYLTKYGYPFETFPNVAFEIDSDENVRKNYSGSYFYRLR